MRNALKIALFAVIGCSLVLAQTTTTVTGTVKDLTQALVTSGKVTFALTPSRDTTIAGYARFSSQTVTCTITGAGLIKALDGVSACTVTMNTALQPTGTYYAVCYWPANVKTACFTFYAVLSSYDWSTVVPTPTTSPAQNYVDIFSNQTIGGTKIFSGSVTFTGGDITMAANLGIAGNFTAGGAGAFGGAVTAKSLNSSLNAALFTGGDIGAKINAAITSLAGTCGRIIVPTAIYSLTTQIVKPKCVDLDLMGSTLNFGTSALPAIVVGDAGVTTAFTFGALRNGIINGNGAANSPLGIWIGGDSGGTNAPANYSDFLDSFVNLTVQNFGAAYKVGYKAFQDMWIGGIIQQNTWGIQNAAQFYSENMNMHGTQIINNTGNGLVIDLGSDFHLYGVSLDYNSGGGIVITSGSLSMHGGNIEQLSGYTISSPASANGIVVGIYNTRLALTNAVGTDPAFINMGGTNSNLSARGIHVAHLHTVTEFVNWQSAGTSNSAYIEFHDDAGTTMVPTSANPNVQSLTWVMPWTGAITTGLQVGEPTFGTKQGWAAAACETSFAPTTLNTGATTTNTGLNCLPATAVIDAVVYRITTTITTAANFTIGDGTTAARFCATQSTLTAGTIGTCFAQTDQTGASGPKQTSAAAVRVTANVNPGAGAIRLIVYYHTWAAPTS